MRYVLISGAFLGPVLTSSVQTTLSTTQILSPSTRLLLRFPTRFSKPSQVRFHLLPSISRQDIAAFVCERKALTLVKDGARRAQRSSSSVRRVTSSLMKRLPRCTRARKSQKVRLPACPNRNSRCTVCSISCALDLDTVP